MAVGSAKYRVTASHASTTEQICTNLRSTKNCALNEVRSATVVTRPNDPGS